MRVPGLNGKRLSKFAPRVSVVPTSGYRFQAANETASMSDDPIQPMPIYSIESEPLPRAFAPSVDSLLPNYPVESMPAPFAEDASERMFFSGQPADPAYFPQEPQEQPSTYRPSAAPESYVVGGSLLSPARTSLAATPTTRPAAMKEEEEDPFYLPLNRPARIAVVLAGIGLLSALIGSAFGVRSQDGPRAVVEQRVGRVESSVVELAGQVRALENQSTAYSSSINALDARLSQKTGGAPSTYVQAPQPIVPRPVVEAPRDAESRSTVRRRVRQAMRELDAIAPAKPQ